MKKILIIEDEAVAAQHLWRTLLTLEPDARQLAVLQSIEESVEYFQQSALQAPGFERPDLVFMDIHLADGLAFRIFEQAEVGCPVVFTTAYDQYALDAFKVNSIDYLLKPIDREALKRALGKLASLGIDREKVSRMAESYRQYRSHFLIPMRDKLIPVDVDQIACLYLQDKITRAILLDGHHQPIDRPLDTLMEQLDPTVFFRANRQYIVARRAIREIALWPIGKLALTLEVPTPDRIIVSKARTPEFKQWYTM